MKGEVEAQRKKIPQDRYQAGKMDEGACTCTAIRDISMKRVMAMERFAPLASVSPGYPNLQYLFQPPDSLLSSSTDLYCFRMIMYNEMEKRENFLCPPSDVKM